MDLYRWKNGAMGERELYIQIKGNEWETLQRISHHGRGINTKEWLHQSRDDHYRFLCDIVRNAHGANILSHKDESKICLSLLHFFENDIRRQVFSS